MSKKESYNKKKDFKKRHLWKKTLSLEDIQFICDECEYYMGEIKTDRREALRIRLSIEEALLKWRDSFGEECKVSVSMGKFLQQPQIAIEVTERELNPLITDEHDEIGRLTSSLLKDMSSSLIYSYSGNRNRIKVNLPHKGYNPLITLLIAVVLGILIGICKIFIPAEVATLIGDTILKPISDTFIDMLGLCGIPLIFISVAIGAYGMGDAETFGRLGKRLVLSCMLILVITSTLTLIIAYPFFEFTKGSNNSFMYTEVVKMILGFLPVNIVAPFYEMNAMQLIILGGAVGIAILLVDPLGKPTAVLLDSIDVLLLKIFNWMTRLMPIALAIIIVGYMWSEDGRNLLLVIKPWLICVLLELTYLVIFIIKITNTYHVKAKILIKKLMPTFIIAMGTDSCTASIPESYAGCGRMGIDSKLFMFGIPIGTSIFKPSCAIRLGVISYFMADYYNVGVSIPWFILLGFLITVFSIAVPAIPGGVLMFYSMLFHQLGIPGEAVTLATVSDIFFDFLATAVSQTAVQLLLIDEAGKCKMLDTEALSK